MEVINKFYKLLYKIKSNHLIIVAMIMIKMIIIAIVIIIMGNNCFIIFIAYKGLHGKKCPIYNDAELTMKEMIDVCLKKLTNIWFAEQCPKMCTILQIL